MIIPVALLFLSSLITAPITDWNQFEKGVRDQRIEKEQARRDFPSIYLKLIELCRDFPFKQTNSWTFPLQGYGTRDLGQGGFRPGIRYGSSRIRGYNFFDGNKHGGHPAYDIFIRDRNHDTLDDSSTKPVSVQAPVDLLVLSTETVWQPGSQIRGGRYVWGLDPLHNHLFYFAHMNEIRVQPGAFIKAGSVIGTVGRTGTNALPARSPTHLHLMILSVEGDTLTPVDYATHLK